MADVMSKEELLGVVRAFLDEVRTASLATVRDDGSAHAANVQFARAAGNSVELYWVSSPGSDHSQHLARHPDVAMTIYAHDDAAPNIHGLQLRGSAAAVPEHDAWGLCWDVYTAKYPFVTTMPQVREQVEAGRQRFYRFTPVWLRWIDNRRGFGWKQTMDV